MAVESLRVGLAFSAGAATFFAPCAYPLLPGYVAYYVGHDDAQTGAPLPARLAGAVKVGGLASLGFFLVYAALSAVALLVGTRALQGVAILEPVVGGLLIVLGLAIATGRLQPGSLHLQLPERRRTATGFLGFGVVYALAAAGCTAPLFVGIAAFALSGGPAATVVTLGAYAAGMAVLMIAVTVAVALGRDGLLRRLSGETGRITRVAGALLALAGAAQIYLYVFDFDWYGGLRLLGA